MAALNFFLLFVFCLHSSLLLSSDADKTNGLKEDTCEAGPWLPNTTIAVKISKKVDGKWKTSFYAHKRMRNPSRVLDLNLKHEVISCGDTKYMALSGKLKDTDVDKMLEDSGKDAASDIDARKKVDARIPTKSDMTFFNQTLGEYLNLSRKSSDRMEKMESRIDSVENTLQSFNETMHQMKNMLKDIQINGSIDSQTIADISDRVKNTESKLVSMEETMNKLMHMMENATRYWSIDSETNAVISDRVENTESKLVSMEETMTNRNLTKDNATRNGRNESQTTAVISDRVENTESKLVSMEETMTNLNLTKDNETQKSKIEEKSNFAFDEIFKGKKIELSNGQRTASRLRPREDDGWYAGVLSNIPLRDDVAFEVRIDETIDEWRDYGISLGVIVKKDEAVKEKAYTCNNFPGTYCIWSWSIGDNGKSHIYKDGKRIRSNGYNLDTRHLPVGSTLGIVRRSDNSLHFLFNGIDRGAVFDNIPDSVFAFVDVNFYVSKITIIS